MTLDTELIEKARRVKLLVMDCDGVLTDGRLYFGQDGEAFKVFDVRDGQGLTLWHQAGFRSAIISGRSSPVVELRAAELGTEFVRQGVADKAAAFEEVLTAAGVRRDETAYIGDDIGDLSGFEAAGLTFAVADAVESVRAAADIVTTAAGGRGAVREAVDLLLKATAKGA